MTCNAFFCLVVVAAVEANVVQRGYGLLDGIRPLPSTMQRVMRRESPMPLGAQSSVQVVVGDSMALARGAGGASSGSEAPVGLAAVQEAGPWSTLSTSDSPSLPSVDMLAASTPSVALPHANVVSEGVAGRTSGSGASPTSTTFAFHLPYETFFAPTEAPNATGSDTFTLPASDLSAPEAPKIHGMLSTTTAATLGLQNSISGDSQLASLGAGDGLRAIKSPQEVSGYENGGLPGNNMDEMDAAVLRDLHSRQDDEAASSEDSRLASRGTVKSVLIPTMKPIMAMSVGQQATASAPAADFNPHADIGKASQMVMGQPPSQSSVDSFALAPGSYNPAESLLPHQTLASMETGNVAPANIFLSTAAPVAAPAFSSITATPGPAPASSPAGAPSPNVVVVPVVVAYPGGSANYGGATTQPNLVAAPNAEVAPAPATIPNTIGASPPTLAYLPAAAGVGPLAPAPGSAAATLPLSAPEMLPPPARPPALVAPTAVAMPAADAVSGQPPGQFSAQPLPQQQQLQQLQLQKLHRQPPG
mmetsp:Transcript_164123/g.315314  ORF Transcript_164123/g.315314 Transcript_164123/m.315314 type:complete len:532 (+) Transcript_164123:53-1648(+)